MDEREFNRLLKNARVKESCFRRLYVFYFPKIVLYVTENYRDADLAQDVAQEFFRMLLTKANLPAYVKYPELWILRMCDGIVGELRREGRAAGRVSLEKADRAAAHMRRLDPVLADSWALLELLDDTTARIVVMFVCEGYGLNEIAAELGMSYEAVRQRYSRGIKLMRETGYARDRGEDDSVQ